MRNVTRLKGKNRPGRDSSFSFYCDAVSGVNHLDVTEQLMLDMQMMAYTRNERNHDSIVMLQTSGRRLLARGNLKRAVVSATTVQKHWRGNLDRRKTGLDRSRTAESALSLDAQDSSFSFRRFKAQAQAQAPAPIQPSMLRASTAPVQPSMLRASKSTVEEPEEKPRAHSAKPSWSVMRVVSAIRIQASHCEVHPLELGADGLIPCFASLCPPQAAGRGMVVRKRFVRSRWMLAGRVTQFAARTSRI